MGCARVRSGSYSSPAKPLAPTGEAPLCGCRDRQRRALGGPQERPERMVAHLGSGRASTVRADRRRTVSGDVRRERQFRFSHAVSVGRCHVGSGNRMGLQAGGHRFDPGTLHLRETALFTGILRRAVSESTTPVRADPDDVVSGEVEQCRVRLVAAIESVERSQVTSNSRRRPCAPELTRSVLTHRARPVAQIHPSSRDRRNGLELEPGRPAHEGSERSPSAPTSHSRASARSCDCARDRLQALLTLCGPLRRASPVGCSTAR